MNPAHFHKIHKKCLTWEYLRVNTCNHILEAVANKKRRRGRAERGGRRGKPLTIYFTDEQANGLRSLAQERHISKTALVKFAVDEMLRGLQSGQLELPLGV